MGQGEGACGEGNWPRDKASGRNRRWVLKHFLGQEQGAPSIWHKPSLKYIIIKIGITHFIVLITVANEVELKTCAVAGSPKGLEKSIVKSFGRPRFHISAVSPSPLSCSASPWTTQGIPHQRYVCSLCDWERKSARSPSVPSLSHCAGTAIRPTAVAQRGGRDACASVHGGD